MNHEDFEKPADNGPTNKKHREGMPSLPGNAGQPGHIGAEKKGVAEWLQKNPVLVRCLVILGLTVLMLLPLGYFTELVDERSELHDEAVENIANAWGKRQTVAGPALVIPYTFKSRQTGNDDEDPPSDVFDPADEHIRYYLIFPKNLGYTAVLSPERRYRGIHDFVVYSSPVAVRGSYQLPEDGPFRDPARKYFWDQAFFCLGVTDLKALASIGTLSFGGETTPAFKPGMGPVTFLGPGFQARVRLSPLQAEYAFSMELLLNGSGGLYVTPVGENTTISMTGAWPHPNFDAQLLPSKRRIDGKGFSADWAVSSLSRTYPQHGELSLYQDGRSRDRYVGSFTAGVSLYETVSLYRQVTRAVKYGILFIGLTFAALFAFELMNRARFHLVQYGLVGVAMTLFYLVLLSFAEHVAFWQAFILASATSAAMCSLYVAAVLRSRAKGLLIAALLATLYAVLFALLRMEEYSLTVGTVLLVGVVSGLMYMTRHLQPQEQADTQLGSISGQI